MLYFDVETDGLLDTMTRAHCLVIRRPNGEVFRFREKRIQDGLQMLRDCQTMAMPIVGHNAIKFDIPALNKLYDAGLQDQEFVLDTLVLARLAFPDVGELDDKAKRVMGRNRGSHSLEAWGVRLGNPKDPYEGGWEAWSQEMEDYCVQDVDTLVSLHKHVCERLASWGSYDTSVRLEHQTAALIAQQERNGWAFDITGGLKFYSKLAGERMRLEGELKEVFPPWERNDGRPFVPKRDDKKRGYVKGVPFQKRKMVEFNPASLVQIGERLIETRGWKPKAFTPTGRPVVDEAIVSRLPYPEAKLLTRYLMVQKRIGMLAEGDSAWLKLVSKEGRIHGSVNTNGAVTGRATHSHPNIAQVPAVRKEYGQECRSLFVARPGCVLVGSDLSGLELRCLAHYLHPYDGGEYGRILLEGDVHSENAAALFGVSVGDVTKGQRENAKTFIYAFLYGAGDRKLGSIVKKGAAEGNKLRERFLLRYTAVARLLKAIQVAVKKRGYLRGLDGRHIPVRSEHAALNTLLQGAGALISKQWIVETHKLVQSQGLKGRQVGWIHDEVEWETGPEHENAIGKACVRGAELAGQFFNLSVPIAAEYKIGRTWADVH